MIDRDFHSIYVASEAIKMENTKNSIMIVFFYPLNIQLQIDSKNSKSPTKLQSIRNFPKKNTHNRFSEKSSRPNQTFKKDTHT